jgi:hypothetical protein
MEVISGQALLRIMHDLISPEGTILLSTPVFNGHAAENHIHEYKTLELKGEIEDAGLQVKARYGTFMNIAGIRQMAQRHQELAMELSEYFDSNAVSCFFAPLYPDLARNNLWVIKRA